MAYKRSNIPEHVRAAWTPDQHRFFEKSYFHHPTTFGPEWITAHRALEMQLAESGRREFFLEYWPHEALAALERFWGHHYNRTPDKGHHAESSVSLRVRKFYPELFTMHLRPRVAPLEYIADTHPHLYDLWTQFRALDDSYHRKLNAAAELAGNIPDPKERKAQLHTLYRLAFQSVYPPLRAVLMEMMEVADTLRI